MSTGSTTIWGCTIIPEDKSTEYIVFAHSALSVVFHDGHAINWNPWANLDTPAPALDTAFDEHLGYDIVGFSNGGFFECSPLSCNGVAKEIVVNRFCLVDDLERAIAIAKDFSTPESRVEPAYGYNWTTTEETSCRSRSMHLDEENRGISRSNCTVMAHEDSPKAIVASTTSRRKVRDNVPLGKSKKNDHNPR